MGSLYHFHASVGTFGALTCGLLNGHDPSCSTGPLTNANETACAKPASTPAGRPCRCTHKVPDDRIRAYLARPRAGQDLWVQAKPRKRVVAKAKRSVAKKPGRKRG